MLSGMYIQRVCDAIPDYVADPSRSLLPTILGRKQHTGRCKQVMIHVHWQELLRWLAWTLHEGKVLDLVEHGLAQEEGGEEADGATQEHHLAQ